MWRYDEPKADIDRLLCPQTLTIDMSPEYEPVLQHGTSSGLSLNHCLQEFMKEEVLKDDEKWYCSRCKTHQVALKKMEVYSAPDHLIIHLKRFSHHRGMFGGQKVTQLVDFPVDELDLGPYVISGGGKYELYAVSNHFGGLEGGHYTADCRSPVNGKWYNFDDSSVSEKSSFYSIVSESAYVLFYRRINP